VKTKCATEWIIVQTQYLSARVVPISWIAGQAFPQRSVNTDWMSSPWDHALRA